MKTWAFSTHWIVFPCLWQDARKSAKLSAFPLMCILLSTQPWALGSKKPLSSCYPWPWKRRGRHLVSLKWMYQRKWLLEKKNINWSCTVSLAPQQTTQISFLWKQTPPITLSTSELFPPSPHSPHPAPSPVLLIWPLFISKPLGNNCSQPFLLV